MSLLTLDQYLNQSPLPCFQRRPPPSPNLDDEATSAAAEVPVEALSEPSDGMYLTDKPHTGVGFYGGGAGLPSPQPQPQQMQQMVMAESSSEDHEVRAPKKRAETWVQEETRSLISLRRELDGLFNTSKSNKHLWEQISARMREKGFDRSPTMCTDKWRNLLKEFKKAKHQQAKGSSGSVKMSYYKELDELIKARNKNPGFKCSAAAPAPMPASKVDAYMQFSDKGLDDANTPFGSAEGPRSCRPALNMDRPLDQDGHSLAITAAEAVAADSIPPWNWRDASANENQVSYGGRVILVKWGEYSRKIGIDGTSEAIKEAIKSAFGLRTKRAFWLEDEEDVVRSLDRDMPLGTYTLHLDKGIKIKVCTYDDTDRIPVRTEEKTFYTEDDFRDFLVHRGWAGLRELSSFANIDTLDDLHPGAMYQGVRLLGD